MSPEVSLRFIDATAPRERLAPPTYEARPYLPEEAPLIYEVEELNWAPWLRADVDTLARRAEVFPEGQIALWTQETRPGRENKRRPIANINLQQFDWRGTAEELPTWDELCGNPADFSERFDPKGNAVGMMSINIHPDYQGNNLPAQVVAAVKKMTAEQGITHIMGSFRPNDYGSYVLQHPGVTLEEFVHTRIPYKYGGTTWQSQWPGMLEKKFGMEELRWDKDAMVYSGIPIAQINEWSQTHKPEMWKEIAPGVLACGEAGLFMLNYDDNGEPISGDYSEGNMWGILANKE